MSTHLERVRKLYKTILKLHRGLPPELQVLGNNYAHDEFRRHKKCSPQEADIFMNEWTDYAINLAKQLGLRGPKTAAKKLGVPLSEEHLEQLRGEQIHQLYELMLAAKEDEEKLET